MTRDDLGAVLMAVTGCLTLVAVVLLRTKHIL